MDLERRDFLKKAGKAVLTGAGWTAVSLFGLNSAGCEGYGLCTSGCTNCTSYCKNCTGCTGCTSSCTSCTSSCTSGTGGTSIKTKIQILLSGWGFINNASYKVMAKSESQEILKDTDDTSFGQWSATHNFNGNLTVEHKSSEQISVEVRRDLIADPKLTEKIVKTFTTASTAYNLSIDYFPVGVYFSVKSNVTNTPVGTVNVTVKDQAGNSVVSDVTDTNGLIKFYISDPINTYPLKTSIEYTAYFSRSGFTESSQSFTIQTDSSGVAVSSAFVVYMSPS
jgi:hypothetical protein